MTRARSVRGRKNMGTTAFAAACAMALLTVMAGASAYAFMWSSSTEASQISVTDRRVQAEEDFHISESSRREPTTMQSANNTLSAMAFSVALACSPTIASTDEVFLVFDGIHFSSSSPDLFQGQVTFSPGDTSSTRISITNKSDRSQTFVLSLDEPEVLSIQGRMLLKAAELVVSSRDGFACYEGTLSDPDLYDGIELITCESGQSVTLDIEIGMPANLGDEYVSSKDVLCWRFSAIPAENDLGKDGMQTTNANYPDGIRDTVGVAWDKTGYHLLPALAAGCVLAGVGVLAFALGRRR